MSDTNLSFPKAVYWLTEKNATVSFQRREGHQWFVVKIEDLTFEGLNFLDTVSRVKSSLWRRTLKKGGVF